MGYKNLQEFVDLLESKGELIRIHEFVNPKLEITEIVDRLSKSSKQNLAVLFENTGTDFPILINALGSEKRIAYALGVEDLDSIATRIHKLFQQLQKPRKGLLEKLSLLPTLSEMSNYFPKQQKYSGACQQVVLPPNSLDKLPILTCWPKDGGPFLTLPLVHTIDPNNATRNIGMYRMQVFSNDMTAMHWHPHKVSAKHFRAYKEKAQKMPVAVALGGDPVYTYAATAPLPEQVDEYILAGFLRKKPVNLVRCLTQPEIWIPEDVDFVIEGFVDPSAELLWEGPFGDHTGFYSLPDFYPAFHITAITHRKNPIFPATIVGIPPQEDAWIGKATERIFLAPIQLTMLPELSDMCMPIEGVFHNLVLAKIKQEYEGQAFKVTNALWGAGQMMFNKVLIVLDANTSWNNYAELAQKTLINFSPSQDILQGKGPMDVLDHSCNRLGLGGKICLDLTAKPERLPSKQPTSNHNVLVTKIQSLSQEISAVDTNLLKQNIPVLLIFVDKKTVNTIANLHIKLATSHIDELEGIKIILFFDTTVPQNNYNLIMWIAFNNIEPGRDTYIDPHRDFLSCDATIKTRDLDKFQRDWPNPVVSDMPTIEAIDKHWDSLGLGEFIPSPSREIYNFMRGEEASIYGTPQKPMQTPPSKNTYQLKI